ncbi:Hypothetical protein CINCED_3A007914 [Cinara cedri]|uniref:Ima1 N-terminal domain-containing protein n=1 Tax=Cinara cedri TaxID=506608 RepID=A0A5E4NRU7_9HEMI|nr:Hypothetical protein CINCED_3A007914 [Cinara cedri]
MDNMIKKYFNNNAFLFSFASDYTTNYLNSINEKPVSSLLAPVTLALFCYYIYVYVRKFYPICVNCWFCNANFKVPFEDRFEYTCVECKQFNGFKNDGSYSKIIPEQHDHRYNKSIFTELQDSPTESKNGLCHKCNIVQELKVKQLASFTPTNEKYFDKEIEIFKKNLEKTLTLCSKCNLYKNKILSIQEQRYNLKSIRMNNRTYMQNVLAWPNICSLCLSFIIFLLSSCPENNLIDWIDRFEDTLVVPHNIITITRLIGMACLCGILCQVYQYSIAVDILSIMVLILWSLLFTVNNFEILKRFQIELLVSIFIILLSAVSIIINLAKKQNIRQTSIKLEDEPYQFSTSYIDTSKKCMSPKTQLRENRFLPGSSNQFIVRLPKFKVARVLNEKIFLEAISKPIQYTTRDEYDYDLNAQYMTSRHNVKMDLSKIVMIQK